MICNPTCGRNEAGKIWGEVQFIASALREAVDANLGEERNDDRMLNDFTQKSLSRRQSPLFIPTTCAYTVGEPAGASRCHMQALDPAWRAQEGLWIFPKAWPACTLWLKSAEFTSRSSSRGDIPMSY